MFSFNVNPGYYQIEPRQPSDPCYAPRPFAPETPGLDLGDSRGTRARGQSCLARGSRPPGRRRSRCSSTRTLESRRRGFLLVYLNSFNEWHEGHAFEPMKDAAELTAAEREQGYCNPAQGDYRLRTLASLQTWLLDVPEAERRHPRPGP